MFSLLFAALAGAADAPPVETVERVDLERYAGGWYELASIPQWYQRGCTGTTAEYTLRDDGMVRVENQCRVGSLDGKVRDTVGRARAVDATNARLEVSFFGPFWGDYWIIGLDPEYRWALVGAPDRDALWVLSRTPTLDPAAWERILGVAQEQGYDTGRLQRTIQPPDAPAMDVPGGPPIAP